MRKDIFQKRTNLILDYLSQILVYGSDTSGKLSLDFQDFDDGKFIMLTVNVLKNSYFRFHDLGIKQDEYLDFYPYLFKKTKAKFKKFSLTFENGTLTIRSQVNCNQVSLHFSTFDQESEDLVNSFLV